MYADAGLTVADIEETVLEALGAITADFANLRA